MISNVFRIRIRRIIGTGDYTIYVVVPIKISKLELAELIFESGIVTQQNIHIKASNIKLINITKKAEILEG